MKYEIKPTVNFNGVENAKGVTWHLMFKQYLWLSGIVLVLSVLLFIVTRSLYVAAIPILYYGYLRTQATRWFMKEFATANNYSYFETLPTGTMKGKLFEKGHSKNIVHAVRTSYIGHELQLFHYRYTVGHGKSSSTYHFTVMELNFENIEFPFILLLSKTMQRRGAKAKNEREIELEEAYKKIFRLFSTEGYEIEVFQIFTPDFLYALQKKAAHYSIEFAKNKMYIYDDEIVTSKQQLQDMFGIVEHILDTAGPLIKRLNDDFAVLHPYYKSE